MSQEFNELKPRDRALLWLAYIEEHNHQEIASALGIARGSVKVLLSRAACEVEEAAGDERTDGEGVMVEWFDRDGNDDDQAVVEYMTRLANAVPPQMSQVPDPGVLWVKAQMLRRWDAERKAQAPLDVMEPIQIAAGIAAAAVLFVWSLPSLIQTLFTSI